TDPFQDIWDLFLMSITVRKPQIASDFSNFYSLIWPILLEVIVFGFFVGELLEKYNPVVTSRILAKHQHNHTVVIGYDHLAKRIIEYCIENKKNFSAMEDNEELVEDLINNGYPVIIGDPTDDANLETANLEDVKEVFMCVDDVRISLICTEKIRKINKECPIYVRVFEDHVQEYLKQDEINAYPFSTSKWAMDLIHDWCKGKEGKAIVIGRDRLTHRIAHHISADHDRDTYLFDDEHDGIEFVQSDKLHIINEIARFLSDIRPHVNLDEVTQVFICWKLEPEFDEALYLTSKFNLRYPNIEIYVRIADEELIDLVERYNAKTFSTSQNALEILQQIVTPDSAIYPKMGIKL
ncbi:MAG: NAD-binding protein, partial [Candidatus Lokiarchaeota archaeon]|nr:NAD-binding protein [Candidatus Lokiarchaeota archaeon]